ncbi:thiamine phosphate synthase [Planococcus sp. ANT_H30]|uniref:thiamine phosphate synthase n=1 Tax=Planococcus sp. ANT_H30 TaxID=2597347 RepID=UPI0011EFE9D3|nr:thiamine phosphate synthase [Planococcus sp. ANT_H30]KAA0959123.1 thiamine phosphate synthase [Planococcus sp. ANT_H30]
MKFSTKSSIYFIMGSKNSGVRDPLQVVEAALRGGINHFQLREKGDGALTGSALLEFALHCQRLCREYSVPFIINDQVELACSIGADGVHIGQDDAATQKVRQLIGADKILGVSVHSVEEAKIASREGADYVGMGPIFGTVSKADAKKPAGVKEILAVKNELPNLPIVGIGGITAENAHQVWQAGVSGIAVITAITEAADIAERIQLLQAPCKEEHRT